MNNLTIKGSTNLFGIEVPNIYGGFGPDQKTMLVKTIAEIHGRQVGHINELINKNRSRFIDGIHIIDLKSNAEAAIVLTDSQIMTKDAINASKNIYALSQRGYVRLLKIMDDDIAWEKWDVIENEYFELKESSLPQMPELSPQLQLLINLELKQKEHDQAIAETKQELQGIREVVALNPTQWRKDTSSLVNKMALKMGGYDHIKVIREESYTLLEQRFGVQLNIRLTNKRKTLSLNGVVKSKIDKINQLDVIADDKKLIEGYVAIIKEMSIKYGVDLSA